MLDVFKQSSVFSLACVFTIRIVPGAISISWISLLPEDPSGPLKTHKMKTQRFLMCLQRVWYTQSNPKYVNDRF